MDDPSNLEIGNSILPREGIKLFEILKGNFNNRENHRKIVIGILIAIIGALSLIAYKINEINTRAFTVYFGGEEIGIVREQDEVLSILENIKKELSNTYDMDIVLKRI